MDEGFTFPTTQSRARGIGMRAVVAAAVVSFVLGCIIVYALTRNGVYGPGDLFRLRNDVPVATAPLSAGGGVAATPVATASEPATVVAQEAREAVERVEQVEVQTGGIDQRVAAMEQRLTRLDLQAQAAAGNAARAEGMLVAFAARRAIERGQPLGFLEDQLRLRFGDARPNAVQTVIAASQDPVTLDQLLVWLNGLATELTDVPESASIWKRLGHEFSQLFAIRTADTPSPVAEARLERARTSLETGQLERAIAEVRAMPNAVAAEEWLVDAERYAAAQRALEVLETAAVLEPRELRDSSGERVSSPSPAN